MDPDSYYPRSKELVFLIVLAGGVGLAIWARWSGSQSNLARNVRNADGGWWWIAGGAVLLLTLAFARCAP